MKPPFVVDGCRRCYADHPAGNAEHNRGTAARRSSQSCIRCVHISRSIGMSPERILVAQGGGPTAVINQSLVGVVLQARRFGSIERVYGARHGVRGIVEEDLLRPRPGDDAQPRARCRHARVCARFDPRQAGRSLLPRDLQGPEGPRDHAVPLHRRQRLVRYGSHRERAGPQRRLRAAVHPHPEDHRQRPGAQRPHARVSVRGAVRRAGVRRARTWTTPRCPASTSPS